MSERNYLLKNAYRELVGHSAEDFSNPLGVPLQFLHQGRFKYKLSHKLDLLFYFFNDVSY